MPDRLRHWEVGRARPAKRPPPYHGHRSMADVLDDEQRAASQSGAVVLRKTLSTKTKDREHAPPR